MRGRVFTPEKVLGVKAMLADAVVSLGIRHPKTNMTRAVKAISASKEAKGARVRGDRAGRVRGCEPYGGGSRDPGARPRVVLEFPVHARRQRDFLHGVP